MVAPQACGTTAGTGGALLFDIVKMDRPARGEHSPVTARGQRGCRRSRG